MPENITILQEADQVSGWIQGYLAKTLDAAGQAALDQWVLANPEHQAFFAEMTGENSRQTALQHYFEDMAYLRDRGILTEGHHLMHANTSDRPRFFTMTWFRYAAILLLIAGTATFFFLNNRPQKETARTLGNAKQADIMPGGNKAVLTLADGTTILLDSAIKGKLADQGNTDVVKPDEGKLVYTPGAVASAVKGQLAYNTVSTPNGGQYQVILPDGTRVWLNAASSIRFPVVFGKERSIEVTGEAYLEVIADKSRSFIVKAGEERIQVLGTSFNVNAYSNEPAVRTSLLEGSVKVNNLLLKPGQACSNGMIATTDTEQDIAWKNGLFNFEGSDIRTIMRQLERWYDVDVKYEGNVPDIRFVGKIYRKVPLSYVLEMLEKMGVQFRTTGKTITIVQRD